MPERKRYTFWISEVLDDGLKALKARDDLSEANILRQALTEYLRKKGILEADRLRVSPRKRP